MNSTSNTPYEKYVRVNRLNIFDNLRYFHQNIKFSYLKDYFNQGIIIDVGSSDLKSLKFWKRLPNVEHIFSLEPSEELYQIGFNKLIKDNFCKNKVTFIRTTGEKDWSDVNSALNYSSRIKLLKMKNVKADIITFEFSFHYLINNIDMVINNIKNFSKSGTKIIIHTLNGNLIKEKLNDQNKFIVKRNDEEVFYLEKLYNDDDEFKQINVYFKGVTGLDNIIPEYIVEQDYLFDKFLNNGFELTEYTEFIERYEDKFNLNKHEIDVSSLYVTYVFTLL